MNRGSDKHQGTNDHNQQARIVNGARPIFHAKVSFQLDCFPEERLDVRDINSTKELATKRAQTAHKEKFKRNL
jgi:hypothetical protein